MKKYYLSCPNCKARLRRTGKKKKEERTLNGSWLYIREYECPKCGLLWTYSESRAFFYPGGLESEKKE